MARITAGWKHIMLDFVMKFFVGAGIGAAADAAVEITRLPMLNQTGMFGDPNMSNFEYVAYGVSGVGFVASVLSVAVGKGIFGFEKHMIPGLLGAIFGIYVWEHTITNWLGIRKWDIYQLMEKAVPPQIHNAPPLY